MQRIHLQPVIRLAVLLLAVLVVTSTVWACPNCKEALAINDPAHDGLVKGYFYSILFMLGMPFTLLSCFSIYMYRQVLRARAERDSRSDPDLRAERASQLELVDETARKLLDFRS